MSYCDKCHVTVRGSHKYCPLCQNKLSGDTQPCLYPTVPTVFRRFELVFKWLFISSIAILLTSLSVNLLFPKHGFWSGYVLFGLICFWISAYWGIRKRENLPRNIMNQTLFVCIFSLLWDFFTGFHAWSLTYVIPITLIVAMGAMAIVAKARRMPVEDYLVCLLMDGIFGIIPIIFILTGAITILIPSIACLWVSILSLSALLIFEGKTIKAELAKRVHI